MREFIDFMIERFGEPAKALSANRYALDQVMQRNRGAKSPVEIFENLMTTIGDLQGEKAKQKVGSSYGIANGNAAGFTDILIAIRATDWKKLMAAPSTKLSEAEAALMADLAEGKEDLTVPPDATIKSNAVLKRVMKEGGLRGPEGLVRARMIIDRARGVREQAAAFAKTQAAIRARRNDADYRKLLADASWAQALKALTAVGATGDEAFSFAKADLQEIALAIVGDEDFELLVQMVPADVLPENEIAQLTQERAAAQKKAAKKAAKREALKFEGKAPIPPKAEEPAEPKAKKPKGKKPAEKPADPAPVAAVDPTPVESVVEPVVDDISEQLKSARKRELTAKSRKELRSMAAKLKIGVPPEVLAASGDGVVKAKEWLANSIVEKEYAATPAPATA